ncbi:MAG: 50S ribosomal protein L25/general stress protein Ctc [Bacteroidales bacterium]|nr:50S ribosomal protein L25/general stress protein Ctc [Bacteroidales bacterium]
MKTIEISASKRTDSGKKKARKLRSEGNIPCVMYGGEENIHFYAHENSFKNLIYTHHVHLVKFSIDDKSHQAVVKEIQFHPVTDKILHIDFIEVFDDKPSIVDIPIEIVGNSVGVRAGGKLRQRKRTLKVKGLVSDMPDVLEINITNLNIGQSLNVRDLNFEKLELLDPKPTLVVGVISSRLAAKGMVIEEAAAAAPEAEAKTE